MIKKLILPVLALLAITSCSSDELLQESPNGGEPLMHFNGLMSNMTRNTGETTTTSLDGGFWVDAYGNNKFYFQEYATKKADNFFYPDNDYYWPDYHLDFVAWYDGSSKESAQSEEATDPKLVRAEDGSFSYTYTVTKGYVAERNKQADSMNANPYDQPFDFVWANAGAHHNSSYSEAQALHFNHIYSQILVFAQVDEGCEYSVGVSSIALRHVPAASIYTISAEDATEGKSISGSWNINFKVPEERTATDDARESTYDLAKYTHARSTTLGKLDHTSAQSLNGEFRGNTINGFYLIPQAFSTEASSKSLAWNGQKGQYGAYLEIDARLFYKEQKKDAEGNVVNGQYEETDLYGTSEATKKIAVPIFTQLTNLEAGKRYIVTLHFTKDGAGQVPPDEDNGGDPILGKPIHFTVDVDGWVPTTSTDNSTTTNIDLSNNTTTGSGTEGSGSTSDEE